MVACLSYDAHLVNPIWQKSGEREAGVVSVEAQSGAAPATVIELNRSPRIDAFDSEPLRKDGIFAGRRYGEDANPLVSPETGLVNP